MTAFPPTAAANPALEDGLFGHPRGLARISGLAAMVIAPLIRPLRGMLHE